MDIRSTLRLADVDIPRLGLGVFRAGAGGEAREAVRWALDMGYRHVDTALTRGKRLGDPRLTAVAAEVARTPAQVLIRWSLQKGYVVIPQSSSRERLKENAKVFDFELDAAQMGRLDQLDEGFRIAWDPTDVP